MMHHRAIPTIYANVQFRSRLEAKWAAFFDACEWPWHYEPVDLDGWIPDFSLGWSPTLCEVKPAFYVHEFAEALAKMTASGYRQPVVLLGAVPRLEAGAIGWIAEWCQTDGKRSLPGDRPGKWVMHDLHIGYTEGNNRLGLCPWEGAWVNVIWEPPPNVDHPNKWARVDDVNWDGTNCASGYEVPQLWAQACNRTQWMVR